MYKGGAIFDVPNVNYMDYLLVSEADSKDDDFNIDTNLKIDTDSLQVCTDYTISVYIYYLGYQEGIVPNSDVIKDYFLVNVHHLDPKEGHEGMVFDFDYYHRNDVYFSNRIFLNPMDIHRSYISRANYSCSDIDTYFDSDNSFCLSL